MKEYVTVSELKTMLKKGWKVIDVRSPYELTYLRNFPGAINIPYPKVVDEIVQLFPDKNAKLIMLCMLVIDQEQVLVLTKKGYKNVYVLLGCIEELND